MRGISVTALVLSLSFVGVGDALAQRSGFIIGFGIGAGISAVSGGDTRGAFATDFKIGAQVNPSVQVYYLGRTNWFSTSRSDLIIAGISAAGVTYLPSPKVQLSGGLGLFHWTDNRSFGEGIIAFTSLGLTGGVGYEFADLWLLDAAVTYGKPDGVSVWELRAGISILSH
jgi:hypothetical protein